MRAVSPVEQKILSILEPAAADLGFRLVRIRVSGGRRPRVQIMAERRADGGMDVEDCAKLSRECSALLDVADPIPDAYTLEVSSPGIDRPLVALEDFIAFTGHAARLELDRLVEGRRKFKGVLAGAEGGEIGIDLEGEDATAMIPFAWIKDARLVLSDDLIAEAERRRGLPSSKALLGEDDADADAQGPKFSLSVPEDPEE